MNDLLNHVAAASNTTFDAIPIIDLQGGVIQDPELRASVAKEIRDACINVGFFYVSNHGVDPTLIADVVRQAKRFFDLPSAEKMEFDIHKSDNFKGYTPLLGENTDPENRGDLHEAFDIGWEELVRSGESRTLNAEPSSTSSLVQGGNVWPNAELLPGFREALLKYYHAVVALGKTLFTIFALALGLTDNFFDDKVTKPAACMRLLHYPPQTGVVDERVIGIGAHTDYECFTILWQDDVPALQVLNTEGRWIDAKPIPGTFVINLGDQFARWTNDIFKSTTHRAINRTGVRRYSMPLFFGTDYDVKLEPIPSCVSAERPPRYEIVMAGEYVKSRLEATYAHSK
ncbi:hypothetical protein M407DRAFT_33441 [Tulasnella calospora MUT 4182]|uniref:Fe2OG dioxygenase domain-containing protein n=1 Tax=Tulasnella calospora MUT 4182 TaxID=1051891 RepID=A0A0C3PQP8_9AGAM|nr:hypothetical protein M407DRAFT_33441 [Tulasnella calospora MUT 4182]